MLEASTGRSADGTMDLASLVAWLVDAGADEIILDAPVDRFALSAAQSAAASQTSTQPNDQPSDRANSAQSRPAQPTSPQNQPQPLAKQAVPNALRAPAEAAAPVRLEDVDSLAGLIAALEQFDAHPLKKTASRLCFVGGALPAEGTSPRVLVLCDKPRTDEDKSGEVLSGKNQLLAERMLAAIGLCGIEAREGQEQVMLANFIPWRPPGNRSVTPQEAELCVPYVHKLLEIVRPAAVLCLGTLPLQFLAGADESPVKARGKWHMLPSAGGAIPAIGTFHPDTLLKSPQNKRLAWQDLQQFRRRLDET